MFADFSLFDILALFWWAVVKVMAWLSVTIRVKFPLLAVCKSKSSAKIKVHASKGIQKSNRN